MVELDRISEADWEVLVAGEREPFGALGEDLVWREKTRNIGVRDDDGRLVAAAGVVPAEVKVGEQPPFQVAGLGGVIVTRSARGRGLARLLLERLFEIGEELELERAMLFCLPQLIGLYRRFGFLVLDAPVWVDQPQGRLEIPLETMWKALGGEDSWPAGRVELVGEPF